MHSLEQSTKQQFAKVFASRDWRLFKEVAEINFAEAAALKMASFRAIPFQRRLLIRNIRKRLLIGIGTELLLKAAYLKLGYGINRLQGNAIGPKLPFRLANLGQQELDPNETYTLGQLADQFKKVVQLPNPDLVLDGLRIAKVFRNKEGHVVTQSHRFNPSSYRAIEAALVEIYSRVFAQALTVRFSFTADEKGVWRVEL